MSVCENTTLYVQPCFVHYTVCGDNYVFRENLWPATLSTGTVCTCKWCYVVIYGQHFIHTSETYWYYTYCYNNNYTIYKIYRN